MRELPETRETGRNENQHYKKNRILLLVGLLGLLSTAGVAQAQTVLYDSTITFTGQAYAPGSASGGISKLIADRITFAGGTSGMLIDSVAFAVFNGNATPQSVRPRIRFWLPDGAGGAPGTYYNSIGFSFSALTFGANSVTTVTSASLGAPAFTVPAGLQLWAGITFDNVGTTTGATDTELSNFGMGIFTPSLGSSDDTFFQTTAAGSFFGTANPAGSIFNFGGNPVANFGWKFNSTVVTPEPGSVALLALGGLGALGVLRRRTSPASPRP